MKKAIRILKKLALVLLIVSLVIAFIAGVLWALDFTGVFNFKKTARKIPVIGQMIPDPNAPKPPKKTPLQLENEKLRSDKETLEENIEKLKKQISDIEYELSISEEKNTKLEADKSSVQETMDSLQIWKEQQEGRLLSYESLARYYGEMKPDKAVKIMNNLSDEITIGILLNLEDEQVTAILSAMEPEKAAKIVDQLSR